MPRERLRGMESFFEPKSVAVAGASTDPNKMGSIIFANLLANRRRGLLRANVYALNPSHDRIQDEPCYPTMDALPETPELLVAAVPESQTQSLIRAAAEKGVRAAVVVTSGYAEVGKGDVEREMGKVASDHGMRVLGPNTIGLLDTRSGVDTLFLRPTKRLPDGGEMVSLLKPLQGGIVVITQSGHLGETVSEELAARGVGIRALVNTGNQLDVSAEDVLEYFVDDPHAKVMVVYIEGIRDGRRFMEVARHASKRKPVVVFKVGKTDVGARAALTHTASMVGDYGVYRAAFRQSGLVEAGSLEELVDYSIALSMLPAATGDRLVVITNAGGVGAIAADEAEKAGLRVEPLAEGSQARVRSEFSLEAFASNASFGNPIDLTASVTTDGFVRATRSVLALPECDLVVVLPTHQAPGMEYDVGRRLGDAVAASKKPVAAAVIGSSELAYRIQGELTARSVPSFPTPERAVRAVAASVEYAKMKELARGPAAGLGRARLRFGRRRGAMRPSEVGRLLRAYGIREPRSVVVRSARELDRGPGLRFPVACKMVSASVPHKKDAGGVVTDVADVEKAKSALAGFTKVARRKGIKLEGMMVQEMVEGGVELILGGIRDRTFGPVVVLGLGGTYTELLHDYTVAVAPLTSSEARELIVQAKFRRVLEGYRGGPEVSIDRLSRVVSRFSKMMAENPRLEEAEINPLIATARGALAVDARGVLTE